MNDLLLSLLTGIPIAQINTYTPQQRLMAVGMAYDKSGMLKPADRIQGIPAGTFDPEEGMYDAYISQRDAFLGNAQGRLRSKLLKKFNKNFDENWKSTEDMRRNEFEWNRDMSDLNSRFNNITLRIKDQTAASVLGIQNSLNSRLPIRQTPQLPAQLPAELPKASFNTNYWLSEAQRVNPNFKSIDDVIAWQKENGLAADGKFGKASRAKWDSLQAPAGTSTKIINGQEYSAADEDVLPTVPTWKQKIQNNYYSTLGNLPFKMLGGRINKHQQGGAMQNEQELLKAFMAYLIEDAAAQGMQIQSEQDLQAYAQQLGEEGLKAKYQEFMLKMQGGVKAALGAKLNYINKLKGNCPEGEELVYMKQGGRVCPVCQKKAEKAKSGDKLLKKNAISDFKEKRKQHINPNDTVHVGGKPKSLTNSDGSRVDKRFPAYTAKDYQNDKKTKDGQKRRMKADLVSSEKCGGKTKKK